MTKSFPPSIHAVLWLIAVSGLWLLPVFSKSTRRVVGELLPQRVRFQQSVAELFTHRAGSWSDSFVLAQTRGGINTMRTVPEEWLSSVEVAGERSRITRLMGLLRRRDGMEGALAHLGAYIAWQVKQHAPEWGNVPHVRLVRAYWPTNLPEMMRPQGGWKLPPSDTIDSSRKTTIATITLQNGLAVAVQLPGKPKKKIGAIASNDSQPNAAVQKTRAGKSQQMKSKQPPAPRSWTDTVRERQRLLPNLNIPEDAGKRVSPAPILPPPPIPGRASPKAVAPRLPPPVRPGVPRPFVRPPAPAPNAAVPR